MNEFKEAKTLYAENQKTLLKEVKEHISKWKAIPSLWIGRLDFVKMTILPKVIVESLSKSSQNRKIHPNIHISGISRDFKQPIITMCCVTAHR